MKTSNFEVDFIKRLRQHVEDNYPELEFIAALRGNLDRSVILETPDALLYNSRTSQALAVEVKGGSSVSSVPAASILSLKAMKKLKLLFDKPVHKVAVVLVTSAFLPPAIRAMLDDAGIYSIAIDAHVDPIRSFDEVLASFVDSRL
ncbi:MULTISPECIES: hypothetical protein [unclassified Duganella]|jgi:hypothetical protein|uniref:hypothetical protein n=1 Tax=unclassified Duganella TaxID=2636909 RepID=UPI00088B8600|nr:MULTISPECIES: hypothetical protein [unclassified Duganella]SDG21634.1 hypothetical protein SAMN05216320_103268 [Duganella sp. OV458]SDJ26681.1 hypothetical protein SAMN05428973_103218 [Duganella sp. OV510]